MRTIKITVTGDTTDWNMHDFDVGRIPPSITELVRSSDLFIADLQGPIKLGGDYPALELSRSALVNTFWRVFMNLTRLMQPKLFSSPRILDAFKICENTCAVMGNNHVKDLGLRGFEDTIALLDEHGIPHTGAGRNREEADAPWKTEIDGKDVYVLNYNYIGFRKWGLFLNVYKARRNFFGPGYRSPRAIRAEIERIKSISPDAFIIVVLHYGRELAGSVEATGVDYRDFEDLGAHCVVFHHTKRIFEIPSDTCFFLGDFVFLEPGIPEDREGTVLELTINPEDNSFEHRLHVFGFKDGYPHPSEGA